MSSKTAKNNTDTTIAPPPATGTGVIGGASPVVDTTPINTGSARAMTLSSILQTMKSSSKLDGAAMAYVEQITKVLTDGNEHISSVPVSTSKVEARAFILDSTKQAIVLIFAKSHQALDMTPSALRAIEVAEALKANHTGVTIVQTIVVTEEDYALAGNMAAYISNAFKTLGGSDAANITVDALKDLKISIVTNIDAVRAYIRQISPHAVPARDDIGILLCIDEPKKNTLNGYTEVEQIPFMAITGYTRIMNPQDAATGMKFVPIPTITDIVSAIPNPSLLAMALPLAADAFICKSLWCRPYSTFRAGQPNLGNLMMDPSTKKPCFTDSAESFHAFIRNYMVNPFLAIDITEGRARPLGIDHLINNAEAIMSNIKSFLTTKNPVVGQTMTFEPAGQQVWIMQFANFTGTYMEKGQVKDTRCVDYLELAAKVTDHKRIDHLLLQPSQPQVKIENIRGIYPEATKSLYVTTTIVLNAPIVAGMASALTSIIKLNYDMPQNGNYNIASLLGQTPANNFDGFASFNTGFGRVSNVQQTLSNIYSNLI
jgi:hypothetical protein